MKLFKLLILLMIVSCSTHSVVENNEINELDSIKPDFERTTLISDDLNIPLYKYKLLGQEYVVQDQEYYYNLLYLMANYIEYHATYNYEVENALDMYYALLSYEPNNIYLKTKILKLENYFKLVEQRKKRSLGQKKKEARSE
jgi:hypothetical protein